MPLPGERLVVGSAKSIDDSLAGLAFQTNEIVERPSPDVVRLYPGYTRSARGRRFKSCQPDQLRPLTCRERERSLR